jgi:hypothetical protein
MQQLQEKLAMTLAGKSLISEKAEEGGATIEELRAKLEKIG